MKGFIGGLVVLAFMVLWLPTTDFGTYVGKSLIGKARFYHLDYYFNETPFNEDVLLTRLFSEDFNKSLVNALNALPENEDIIIGIAKLLEFNQTATDTILQQLIKSNQNIVLASYLKNGELVKPHPFFSQEATVGFIDYEALAENGMVEKSFLQKTFNGKTANHFSLELAKKHIKYNENISIVEESKIIHFVGNINFEDERMPSFLFIEELERGEVSTFDGSILIIEEFDSYTYYYEDLPMDTSNLFSTPYTNYSLANSTPSKMSQATIVANQVDMILNDRFINELSLFQRSILYVATFGFFLFLFVQMNRVRFFRE